MKEKLRSPEVWCKVGLVFIFGAFYVTAGPYPEKAREFPRLLASVSLMLAVVSLAVDLSRKETVRAVIGDVDDTELKTLDEGAKRERRGRFYRAWAIIAVSTAAGFLGGFLLTAFFLFAGFAVIFGPRRDLFRNAVVSVAATAVIYFLFERLMGVPLLEGILW